MCNAECVGVLPFAATGVLMSDIRRKRFAMDGDALMLSFTTAALCAVASCRELLPSDCFQEVSLGAMKVDALKKPNSKCINLLHKGLFAFLSNDLRAQLRGKPEMHLSMQILPHAAEGAESTKPLEAYVIVYKRNKKSKKGCAAQANEARGKCGCILRSLRMFCVCLGDVFGDVAINITTKEAAENTFQGMKKSEMGCLEIGGGEIRSVAYVRFD